MRKFNYSGSGGIILLAAFPGTSALAQQPRAWSPAKGRANYFPAQKCQIRLAGPPAHAQDRKPSLITQDFILGGDGNGAVRSSENGILRRKVTKWGVTRRSFDGLMVLPFIPKTYAASPDSRRQPGVPQGTVTRLTWNTSKIDPGTTPGRAT